MKRRDFLRLIGGVGLAGAFPGMTLRSAMAADVQPFSGKVLITITAGGGWDHSSFCDPRENPDINHWAKTQSAGTAGNLRYAPFAENAEIFDKYHDRMLVINGIDLQSNGHGGASMSHGTGGLSGYPVLNAIYGAVNGAGLPMPWLYASGRKTNLGVQAFTRLPSDDEMRTLADSNRRDEQRQYLRSSDMTIIERYRRERLQAQMQADGMPYRQAQLATQYDARANRGLMDRLAAYLPDVIDDTDLKGENIGRISTIHRFLVAAQAGICVTCNMTSARGFDTHGDHDNRHTQAMLGLNREIDYLWTKAEQMGIADRIVLHLNSDVGRTPHYNGANGKDHWSNGSSAIMMKGQPWTNRVVGISGPTHKKVNIDPVTLQEDTNGERLRTAHVHRALRRILGVESDPLCRKYDFDVPEIDLLNPAHSSPVNV